MDRLFDYLNCHSPFGKGFKSPLTRNNHEHHEKIIHETIDYLDHLTLLDGRQLSASRWKTFVIGFKAAALAYLGLGKYVFANYPDSKCILSYKLGQDHLETLFSKIRAKGGFNNNPDCITFLSALRSLLVKSDITASPNANCIGMSETSEDTVILAPKKRPSH